MDDANRDPVELLAEDFIERRRNGEAVTVEEYAAAHPDVADEIRDLFPTIAALETARSGDKPRTQRTFDCPERLGDLRIVREIGRGGMGVVYEAEQESLERRVAVKVLPGRTLFDTKQLERFRREARTAGALHHPGIVPVFSVGEQDGLHYLVMQLIDGVGLDVLTRRVGARTKSGSLASGSSVNFAGDKTIAVNLEDGLADALVAGRFDLTATVGGAPPLPSLRDALTEDFDDNDSLANSVRAATLGDSLNQADDVDLSAIDQEYYRSIAKIGAQAAEALAYAHSKGTLHRDIKPANLLLDRSGRVWITDFGLAKAVDQTNLSRTGELLGTLRYMAPEQLRGEASALSDLYALGLTLYELVTFRSPFAAPTPSEVLQKINEHQPERPRKINPRLPLDLERIILQAMAPEPGGRYASGDTLAEDLRRFLDEQPVTARSAGPVTELRRWSDRHRVAAAVVATTLVLGSLAMALWPSRPPDPVPARPAAPDAATSTADHLPPDQVFRPRGDVGPRPWQAAPRPRFDGPPVGHLPPAETARPLPEEAFGPPGTGEFIRHPPRNRPPLRHVPPHFDGLPPRGPAAAGEPEHREFRPGENPRERPE